MWSARFVTTRDNERFLSRLDPCFIIFRATFSFLRHTVAKCDRPLYDLLVARNCQGSLYGGLTSYKNVTILYSLQLVAYWISRGKWKKNRKRRSHVP